MLSILMLMIFAALLRYLSSSQRKSWKIQIINIKIVSIRSSNEISLIWSQ